jgi:hypothetical protein
VAVGEVDVFFVEDGSPLEGGLYIMSVTSALRMKYHYLPHEAVDRLCNGSICSPAASLCSIDTPLFRNDTSPSTLRQTYHHPHECDTEL